MAGHRWLSLSQTNYSIKGFQTLGADQKEEDTTFHLPVIQDVKSIKKNL